MIETKKIDYYLKILKKKKFVEDKSAKSLSFFFKGKDTEAILDHNLIKLIKKISKLLNKNLRINLHKNIYEKYHDMIILQRKNTYIKPHRHVSGGETVHMLHGKMTVLLMNYKGKVIKKILMDTKKNVVYRVPHKNFHTYRIETPFALYHENKSGPFIKNKNTIFLKK